MTFKRLHTYWQLFWQFRRYHLMRTLEYRGDFFFWSGISVVWTIFNFFFLSLILNVGHGLGGWSVHEVYVLLAIYTMLDALTWSFFHHNMSEYTKAIYSGSLNYILLKPIDPQFMLMTQWNSYNNVARFFLGLGLLGWALWQGPQLPSLVALALAGLFFIVVCVFIAFLWFSLSTLGFWAERLDNINEIIPSFRRIWQVPRTVYEGVVAVVVTMVVPIALISSLPSEAILEKNFGWWGVYFVVFTVGLVVFSRWFFMYSIKKYAGVAN